MKALLLAFLLVEPGLAGLLVLTNGDRISGEIKTIAAGKVSVETDYAGKISVDWTAVETLEGIGAVEVLTQDGRRFLGTVTRTGGTVEVAGDRPVRLDPAEVERIGPPLGFWDRLNGGVDLGYSLARGNSNLTQSSVSFESSYKKHRNTLTANASSLFSEQDDLEANSRHTGDARYDRSLGGRAFAFSLASFEINERQNLDLRTILGGGFGWKLIEKENSSLSLLGGTTFTREDFDNGEDLPGPSSAEGLLGVEWRTVPLLNITYSNRVRYLPSFTRSGRYRLEFDSSLRVPVVGSLSWSLSLYDRFDSDPPVAVKRNDYGLVSAFGFGF